MKLLKKGLKDSSGKYFPVWYSKSTLYGRDGSKECREAVVIYAKHYERFSDDIRQALTVENNSDSMTDYFETDRIVIEKSNPLYNEIIGKGWAR